MTPLIISCKNGHQDVALYLSTLTTTNLNHLDKVGIIFIAVLDITFC